MATITAENAKRIRQPFDVVARLEAVNDDALTVAAESPVEEAALRVYDFSNITNTWPLIKLADFAPGSFPLDGSRLLYSPSMTQSATAGKLGVRTYISITDVILTVSSTVPIPSLTICANGCDHLSSGGVSYTSPDNLYLIPVNASTVNVRFWPNAGERVEIQYILPSLALEFTNDDLISVELNLRSDLSPIDPSLPESEIEIKAYSPRDVTEVMQYVMDDQPITYYAGYPGDYSTARHFYLSEPIEYEDNVITIRGVDAVRKLENDCPHTFIGYAYWDEDTKGVDWYESAWPHRMLYLCAKDQLDKSGIVVNAEAAPGATTSSKLPGRMVSSYIPEQPRREVLANLINLLHQDYTAGYFNGLDAFYLNYVDAGIPTLTWSKPVSKWDIYEADCGDIKRNVDRRIVEIKADNQTVKVRGQDTASLYRDPGKREVPRNNYKVGTAKITKGEAAQYTIDELAGVPYVWGNTEHGVVVSYPVIAGVSSDVYLELPSPGGALQRIYGKALTTGDYWQDWDYSIAFTASPRNMWETLERNYEVTNTDTDIEFSLVGGFISLEDAPKSYTKTGVGIIAEPSNTKWSGVVRAGKYGDTSHSVQILPDRGFQSLLNRSNETGSFTWKGDPRMQPRDVFTWHYLDGSTELRTIETISLKHEGGGTLAEITYRKGVV